MKKHNWDEAEIKNLLKEMPSMKDSRSRKEIYEAVKGSGLRKKPRSWGYPAIAGIAAILILFLISPSLFNSFNQTQYENSTADMAADDAGEAGSPQKELASMQESEENAVIDDNSNNTENSEQSLMRKLETAERPSVYEEDLLQYDLFTFGLVTPDASVVPMSVLVENQDSADWLERFKEVSEEIPEQSWGFDEYYPLPGTLDFNKEDNELTYTVTEKELTIPGSGGEEVFYDSIAFSLNGSGYEKMNLQNEDGSVPSFSHMGEISEIPKAGSSKNGYFKYSLPNGESYLISGENEYISFNEALEGMKSSSTSLYETLIPEDIQFEVTLDHNLAAISFEEPLLLNEEIDPLFADAILLTAREFGYDEVLFKNIENTTWNGFDFTKPISVPLSPNKKVLNLKDGS